MRAPEVRRDSRPEDTRRVHRRAGQRAAEKNVERHGGTDGQTGDAASTFIHCGPMHHEDEEERENGLNNDAFDRRQRSAEFRRARDDDSRPNKPRMIKAAAVPPSNCAIQ